MNEKVPAPGWFTAVAIIALLWNLLGVAAYLMTTLAPKLMTPELLDTMSEADRAATEASMAQLAATPGWVTGAFAVAVFGGLIGSILLLMKKNLAVPVLALSLLAVLVQNSYTLFMSGQAAGAGAALPILVLVFAAFLVWVAMKAKNEGWSN